MRRRHDSRSALVRYFLIQDEVKRLQSRQAPALERKAKVQSTKRLLHLQRLECVRAEHPVTLCQQCQIFFCAPDSVCPWCEAHPPCPWCVKLGKLPTSTECPWCPRYGPGGTEWQRPKHTLSKEDRLQKEFEEINAIFLCQRDLCEAAGMKLCRCSVLFTAERGRRRRCGLCRQDVELR